MAGSRTYRTVAIVLDKTKLKETDLILTLLGGTAGRYGPSPRAPASPDRALRRAASCSAWSTCLWPAGRSLDVVSQADLKRAPLGCAPSFESLTAASAIAELARLCTFEDAYDPFVFAITDSALSHIGALEGDAPHMDVIVAAYAFKLLSHLGYRPVLDQCVACGDPHPGYFSASAGGLLCGSCSQTVAGAEALDPGAGYWLRSLLALRFDDLASSPVDAFGASMLLAQAHIWSATHLDCRLRSLEFMLGR